jgi:hypothetical protein
VTKSGAFTASLNWGGARIPLKGSFGKTDKFSTVATLSGGTKLTVSLGFDAFGNLTGSVAETGTTYNLVAALVVKKNLPAAGSYPFVIIPDSTANGVPAGIGYGYLDLRTGGAATLAGTLGDGTHFSAASVITVGNTLMFYVNPYGPAGIGLSGELTYEDITEVSDCDGWVNWARASDKSTSPYAKGFTTGASFIGTFSTPVKGLNGDVASFDGSGADLTNDVTANVTLHSSGVFLPVVSGTAANFRLNIISSANYFSGNFWDSTSEQSVPFSGVLLPKGRIGAGSFFSGGVSGTVEITY